MASVKAAESGEIPQGGSKVLVVNRRELAVFRIEDNYYCIDNSCPHQAGPLNEGPLNGEVIMCPWHAWQVNVRTGEVLYFPNMCVNTFPCSVESDGIYIEV